MGWTNADIALEKNGLLVQSLNKEIETLKEDKIRLNTDLDIAQSELFKAKTKLGEVFNIILEHGNKDIIDTVEGIMSNE